MVKKEKKVKKVKKVKKEKKVKPLVKPPKVYKKRGRKPKGGKIIAKKNNKIVKESESAPNIILHLKCCSAELKKKYSNATISFDPLSSCSLLNWKDIHQIKLPEKKAFVEEDTPNKPIWDKLKQLSKNLHFNDVSDKKSNCFWCTCSFDNPPIYIPRQERNNIIEVYGCFCSPECACGYLNKEHIDSSTFWERYALLNNIYGKIYNQNENIKPAPDPYHTLDKYYGNLSIQEYRKLLKNDRILIVVDKPLTKILPELHDEKNENPLIYSNLLSKNRNLGVHYRLKRKEPKYSKNNILNSAFNLKN